MRTVPSDAAERTAEWYRNRHYWPVRAAGKAAVLPMGQGFVAIGVPSVLAPAVWKALERHDLRTPAFLTEKPQCRVVFLAEADEAVLGQFQMPRGVHYLAVPQVVALPSMPAPTAGGRKWLCAPDPGRRWLPSAGAVLAAVNEATPFDLRARNGPHRLSRNRLLIG